MPRSGRKGPPQQEKEITRTVKIHGLSKVPAKLTLDGIRDPWDIQPKENPRHFAFFALYRDMPPQSRSCRAVASLTNLSIGRMHQLCAAMLWVARANAWDYERQRIRLLDLEDNRMALIKQHLRVSEAMMAAALARLVTLDTSKMGPRDLATFVQVAGELGRKALGMENGPRTSVTVGATAVAASPDSELGQQHRAEVRVMFEQVRASMESFAANLVEQDVRDAATYWLGQLEPGDPAAGGEVLEGEVLDQRS